MLGLTDKQYDILNFIAHHLEREGWPPSLREICQHFKLVSTNAANDHLNALERKGFIARRPMTARGIRLTTEGREAIA